MKEIKTQKTLTFEESIYQCDKCDFQSNHKETVEEHQAKSHSVKGMMQSNMHAFRYFETKEAAENWARVQQYDITQVNFDKPGWYGATYDSQPCRRGCCTESVICLRPLSWFKIDSQNTIDEHTQELDRLTEINASKPDANTVKDI